MAGFLLASSSAQALTIGPAKTKNEREKSSSYSNGKSYHYQDVLRFFLKQDFAAAESAATHFMKHRAGEADYHEAAYLRALSLMKLGRFAEARPLLQSIEQEAQSRPLRAHAAYSLGDSYYFAVGEDKSQAGFGIRKEADAFYREALRKYPEHGEASAVRKLLGIDHLVAVTPNLARQFGVEEASLFTVQVGAFSRERNAQRLLNRLLQKQFEAYIERIEGSSPYRVRVGHFADPSLAEKESSRLHALGYRTKIVSEG